MSQKRPDLAVGVLKFYSHEELTKFLRELAEYYQKEAEKYGDKLGSMLRPASGQGTSKKDEKKQDKEDKKGDKSKAGPGGWIKMGSVMVNVANPESASTEVMYQVHEELKAKLAKTNEALKSFETSANSLIPHDATLQLYVRNGVPERIIVEAQEAKKAAFSFDGRFRIV